MTGGVHAHQLQAALPVDAADDGSPIFGSGWLASGTRMISALDCPVTVAAMRIGWPSTFEHAGVAGLAAAGGVEIGGVEDDAAALVDMQHLALAGGQIGVVEKGKAGGKGHERQLTFS